MLVSCTTLPPVGGGGTACLQEHVQKRDGTEAQLRVELPGAAEQLWLRGSHVDQLLDALFWSRCAFRPRLLVKIRIRWFSFMIPVDGLGMFLPMKRSTRGNDNCHDRHKCGSSAGLNPSDLSERECLLGDDILNLRFKADVLT